MTFFSQKKKKKTKKKKKNPNKNKNILSATQTWPSLIN